MCWDENTLVFSGQVHAGQALPDTLRFQQEPAEFETFPALNHGFRPALVCACKRDRVNVPYLGGP
jgi:hypothetical protein